MNAIEFIKENIDPIKILEYYGFHSIQEKPHEIRACCKIHGGNNPEAFIWNKENNLWFCYTGECGGGDVFDLISKLEKEDTPSSQKSKGFLYIINKTASILGLDIQGMDINLSENRIRNEQRNWLKQYKFERNVISQISLQNLNLFDETSDQNKRFKTETYPHYGAQFAKEVQINDKTFYNKLIIPIYEFCNQSDETPDIIGYALRSLDSSLPKWIYQPRGLHLNNQLYFNLQYHENNETKINEVLLVEGIFDVWAFHEIGIDNVMAIYGSHISQEQYNLLMRMNVTLTFCFDNDDAGRKCTKQAIEMFQNKTDYKQIQLPEGHDPDDIPREELMSCYLNRK